MFGSKSQTPEAERRVAEIAAKLADDERAQALALEEVERVAIALELPEGTGLVRCEADLKDARVKHAEARERAEGRRFALSAAQARLAEAQAHDAQAALTEQWEAQAQLAPVYKAKLAEIVTRLRETNAAILEALALRDRATMGCPEHESRFGGMVQAREVEGLDRLLHIRDLVIDFHPRYRSDTLGGTLEDAIASEHAVIDTLTTRHLKIEPAPPPPKPPERVQGPMPRIGRVA